MKIETGGERETLRERDRKEKKMMTRKTEKEDRERQGERNL